MSSEDSPKRRYLESGDPRLFRLSFLLDPRFVLARLRSIRSRDELRRRAADLLVLLRLRAHPAARRLWEWRADRALDAKLERARRRAAGAAPSARVAAPAPNPPHPLETNAPCAVHLSWNIHIACNYDCVYCFFHGAWDSFAPDNRYLSPEEWIGHWRRFNARHGAARVDIAGGEPFTYPGFVKILADLAARNVVVVSTNLCWDPAVLIGRVPAGRVEIAASFHPEYVPRPDAFIGKIEALRRAGFHANVSMVAYPSFLSGFPALLDAFARRGIGVGVQPFRGRLEGRLYPEAYTPKAKAYLDGVIRGGGERPAVEKPAAGAPSPSSRVDPALVVDYQLERASTRGKSCNAGRLYGRLQSNGDVTRCAQGVKVGSFFDESFAFWDRPKPCPFAHCDCINEILYVEGGPLGPRPS